MTSSCTRGYFSAMKFTLDARAGINLIRAYSASELRIGERTVVGSCIVTADTLITDWQARAPDELGLVELEPLLALAPQIVLLGAPAHCSAAPANLRSVLAQQGIALEVMDLGAACRTFNILVQEERRVAAALFLEKESPEKKAT
jgi:uncharacterized protein